MQQDDAILTFEDIEHFKGLVKKTLRQNVPRPDRLGKAMGDASKSLIRDYLRDNGLDDQVLTTADYEFITNAIEQTPPANSWYYKATYVKKYLFRQLKRLHSPVDTAKYLKYSFRETFEYFTVFLAYMFFIYVSCNRLPYVFCIFFRVCMSIHLGYYTFLWLKRITVALRMQLAVITKFTFEIMFYVPAIVFETTHVLFDAFIGWPLLSSILGMVFMTYIFPIAFPEMGLSSIYVELYTEYVGQLPMPVRILTFFI